MQRRTGLPIRLLPTVVVVLRLRRPRHHKVNALGLNLQLHFWLFLPIVAGRVTRTPIKRRNSRSEGVRELVPS